MWTPLVTKLIEGKFKNSQICRNFTSYRYRVKVPDRLRL